MGSCSGRHIRQAQGLRILSRLERDHSLISSLVHLDRLQLRSSNSPQKKISKKAAPLSEGAADEVLSEESSQLAGGCVAVYGSGEDAVQSRAYEAQSQHY
jgi:hypothetical protein